MSNKAVWELIAARDEGSVTALRRGIIGGQPAVVAATLVGLRVSFDLGESWRVLGRGWAGPVESIAFLDSEHVLAGASTGLYRIHATSGQVDHLLSGTGVSAIHVRDDSLILAGTIDDGVLRSTDGGSTWSGANGGLLESTVVGLGGHSSASFAATPGGIYRSRNDGRTWRPLAVPLDGEVTAFEASSGHDGTGRLWLGATGQVLRSVDGGATWEILNLAADETTLCLAHHQVGNRVVLAVATPSRLVLFDDSHTSPIAQIQLDGPALGATFADAPESLLLGMASRGVVGVDAYSGLTRARSNGLRASLAVSFDVAGDTVLLAGVESGVEALSNGRWSPVSTVTAPAYDVVVAGDAAYAASADGVHVGRAGDSAWERLETGLASPVVQLAARGSRVAAVDAECRVGASTDGGRSWKLIAAPNPGLEPIAISVGDDGDTILLATSAVPTRLQVALESNPTRQLALWQSARGGRWDPIFRSEELRSAAIATWRGPDGSTRVVAALGARIIRQQPGQFSRTAAGRRESFGAVDVGSAVTSLVEPVDGDSIIAATTSGLVASADGGATFHELADSPDGLPILAVRRHRGETTSGLLVLTAGGGIWRLNLE